jgi:hypothetical protein
VCGRRRNSSHSILYAKYSHRLHCRSGIPPLSAFPASGASGSDAGTFSPVIPPGFNATFTPIYIGVTSSGACCTASDCRSYNCENFYPSLHSCCHADAHLSGLASSSRLLPVLLGTYLAAPWWISNQPETVQSTWGTSLSLQFNYGLCLLSSCSGCGWRIQLNPCPVGFYCVTSAASPAPVSPACASFPASHPLTPLCCPLFV